MVPFRFSVSAKRAGDLTGSACTPFVISRGVSCPREIPPVRRAQLNELSVVLRQADTGLDERAADGRVLGDVAARTGIDVQAVLQAFEVAGVHAQVDLVAVVGSATTSSSAVPPVNERHADRDSQSEHHDVVGKRHQDLPDPVQDPDDVDGGCEGPRRVVVVVVEAPDRPVVLRDRPGLVVRGAEVREVGAATRDAQDCRGVQAPITPHLGAPLHRKALEVHRRDVVGPIGRRSCRSRALQAEVGRRSRWIGLLAGGCRTAAHGDCQAECCDEHCAPSDSSSGSWVHIG